MSTNERAKTGDWVDVSVPLHPHLPVWPGNSHFRLVQHRSVSGGDQTNDSKLEMDLHSGTHLEGSRHLRDSGESPADRNAADFIMPIFVTDSGPSPQVGTEHVPKTLDGARGLLFKTSNTYRNLWAEVAFTPDYCALDEPAAQLASRLPNLALVGIDYLSIQAPSQPLAVHEHFLDAGIVVLEGLDLHGVNEGHYEMLCLPIRIPDAESAPCRVLLRPSTERLA